MTRAAACASGRRPRPCPDSGRRGWVAALTFSASLAASAAAWAQPPDNADPTLAPWFRSLQAPNGISCCSIADCRTTDYRTAGDGYEALIGDRWIAVPRDRVLDHVDNPTGRAVVCYMPAMGILCFVRPSDT